MGVRLCIQSELLSGLESEQWLVKWIAVILSIVVMSLQCVILPCDWSCTPQYEATKPSYQFLPSLAERGMVMRD